MAFEERPQCSGAIFTNDKKEGKQPDYNGKVEITKPLLKQIVEKMKNGEVGQEGGVVVRLALWNNTSKQGRDYFYTRMDIPQQQQVQEPTPPVVEETPELSDDDIPF